MKNPNPSKLQKTVKNINPKELDENLDVQKTITESADLVKAEQTTPFIDESLRTDK